MPPADAHERLRDLQFVGPSTAAVLADAGVSPEDVVGKRVSHAQLVEYGVNPGVAARIRREHSLQWSFEGGEDLDQRAEQVRGLQADERQWVAASHGESDQSTEADGSGDATAEEAAWQAGGVDGAGGSSSPAAAETEDADGTDGEAAWRERGSWPDDSVDESFEREEAAWREASTPTPVSALDGVDEDVARLLATAGITSVRSLATAHVDQVADSLGVSSDRVASLRDAAREHVQ